MPRLIPKTFYSLREAVDAIGRHLFPDEWTGDEADARNLPPPDEGTRFVEERARLKVAAAEAGLRDRPLYDLLNPPSPPPDCGGGAGMPEPDTPRNRLRRRLRDTEGVERWPEAGSPGYETERAAYRRWAEAEAELIEALREGHLTAVARTTDGARIRLTPEQWRNQANSYRARTSRFEWSSRSWTSSGSHCELPADSLRKLLDTNQSTTVQGPAAPAAAEYRIGFPGRPSLKSAVIQLAEERARSGVAEQGIATEAEALAREIKRLHPDAPSHPTARTLETHVREVRLRLRRETAK